MVHCALGDRGPVDAYILEKVLNFRACHDVDEIGRLDWPLLFFFSQHGLNLVQGAFIFQDSGVWTVIFEMWEFMGV